MLGEIKARLEKEATEQYTKAIAEGLLEECKNDEKFIKVLHESKRKLTECFNYIKIQAKKAEKNGCACVRNDVVYGWAKDFFLLSEEDYKKLSDKPKPVDITEEKPNGKETNTESEKAKAKPERPIIHTTIKHKADSNQNSKDQLDGQMDIFSFI